MQNINLENKLHRGQRVILIHFKYDEKMISVAKSINAKWSQSNKAWYLADNQLNLKKIKEAFRLDEYSITGQPDEVSKHLSNFSNWLEHKRYSESTIKTYLDSVKKLLLFWYPKHAEDISSDDMVKFVNDFIIANKYSYSFQNQVVNASKLFFREVIKSNLDVEKFERPRQHHKLPNVLSKEEVKKIIESPKNIKHKTALSLVYACGLRRSELLRIKISDIDSKRMLLRINNSKGKKDRIVPISEKLLTYLREYYKTYKPEYWLFEGSKKGKQYSEESLAKILKRACRRSGINKNVSLHWLRHSYATHLHESGTDIRLIQELLGHKSTRTTEIYTHVSTKSLKNIKSPFDDI